MLEAPPLELNLALFTMTSAAGSTASYKTPIRLVGQRQLALPRYILKYRLRQLGARQCDLCACQPVEVTSIVKKAWGANSAPRLGPARGESRSLDQGRSRKLRNHRMFPV